MTPYHLRHNRTRRGEANAFLVWRAGQSVDWHCTALDIAAETGLTRKAVYDICKARGWLLEQGPLGNYSHLAVDDAMETASVAAWGRKGVDLYGEA